jgi:hypothetical protein
VKGKTLGHPKETNKAGIGRKGKSPFKRIKPISKKGRKRAIALDVTFETVKEVQRRYTGGEDVCLAKFANWPANPAEKFHASDGLVPDHVFTRNGTNVDRHSNLQGICSWCNGLKGSRRIDFRPIGMIKELLALDLKK